MSDNPSLTDENVPGLMLDNCPDLFALLDANGTFLYNNPAHFIRLGRRPESLVGATVSDLVHPEDAAAFKRAILGSFKRRTIFKASARWLRDSGRGVRFDSLGQWVRASDGLSPCLLLCSREAAQGETAESLGLESAELRVAAARLLARAESEKNRVARAIHDDLGQRLTALNLELSVWKSELDSDQSKSLPAIRKKLAVLNDLTSGLISFTRQVAGTLRPRILEAFGLAAALESHLEKVQKQTGLRCRFTSGPGKIELDEFVAAQLFRIGEEVIEQRVNAGCKSLQVRLLTQDDALSLIFADSGKERRLSPEVSARVCLIGGEIQLSNEKEFIMVTLPNGA